MKRGRLLAVLTATGAGAILAVGAAPSAAAHPLGNFTHNTYVAFTVSADRISVDHVLDLAEVPTFQERAAMDANGDGAVSPAEAADWGRSRCSAAAAQITGRTDVGAVSWTVGASTVSFPEGQGGLPTTRLECALTAPTRGATTFDADVAVEEGRVGWHEVVAVGDGISLSSDVPATSSSARLTAYSTAAAPLDVSSAHLSWGPAGITEGAAPAAAATTSTAVQASDTSGATAVSGLAPFGLDSAAQAFTDLIGRQDVTLGFVLLALMIALGLGGMHALAPGHGKTLMAASLVGTGGRRRDAVILGATVTTAHTAGVVALALVLSVSSAVAPEKAYPWLGLASAVIAVAVGVSLLRQARHGGGHGHSHPQGSPHSHDHGDHEHGDHEHGDHEHGDHEHGDHEPGDHEPGDHEHGHGGHDHPHPHPHGGLALAIPETAAPAREGTAPAPSRPATRRVIALGLAGGLVPSPSAVVVLLAGFALGRSWFALLLVVAFGLGMAVTLCMTGLLVVRAGGLSRRIASGHAVPRPVAAVLGRLPLIAAVTVIVAGLWIAVRSITAL